MSKWSGSISGYTPRQSGMAVDSEWRRWIAENVLLGNSAPSIVDAMIKAGVAREMAVREVQAAIDHPYVRAARGLKGATAGARDDSEPKIQKRDWVFECYRRLARQSSWHGRVPRVPKLSREQFLEEHYSANRPVVMTGAFDDWPAMTRWTSVDLKRRFGERIVSVQANRNADPEYEQNSDRHLRDMKFGDVVDLIETGGETNDYYITANNSGTNKEALKELWEDIVLFPEYLRDDEPGNRGFFWFGPKGTVTPLHHDLTNNFMAQVRGRKLVRLVAPYELPHVYNDRHCFSRVDVESVDHGRFPAFRDVTVVEVELRPGDLLFLPVGWWHHVRGLEISITMTFTNFSFDNDFHSMYTTFRDI